MRTMLISTALASVLAIGLTAPSHAQIELRLGAPDSRNDARAERIEERGAARAERAADHGNYRRAAKIKRRSERRANRVEARDGQHRDDQGIIIFRAQ